MVLEVQGVRVGAGVGREVQGVRAEVGREVHRVRAGLDGDLKPPQRQSP